MNYFLSQKILILGSLKMYSIEYTSSLRILVPKWSNHSSLHIVLLYSSSPLQNGSVKPRLKTQVFSNPCGYMWSKMIKVVSDVRFQLLNEVASGGRWHGQPKGEGSSWQRDIRVVHGNLEPTRINWLNANLTKTDSIRATCKWQWVSDLKTHGLRVEWQFWVLKPDKNRTNLSFLTKNP